MRHLAIPSAATVLLLALVLTGFADAPPASSTTEPPAPAPTAAVQKILDEAAQHAQAKRDAEALSGGDRALAVAQEARDTVGEAQAQRVRGRALEALTRMQDAFAAFASSAAAWQRVGDGPGQIEALAAAGQLLEATNPADADALFGVVVALGRGEAKRPLAAAQTLHAAGQALGAVGETSGDRRRLGAARDLLAAALALREKRVPSSLDVAATLIALGSVTVALGDLAGARVYSQRALDLQERLAPDSLDVAASLMNLADVAGRQGKFEEATGYCQRALAIQERRAPDSLTLAATLFARGNLYLAGLERVAARECYQRALAIEEKLAPDSPRLLTTLERLRKVAITQQDLASAVLYARRALTIQEKLAPNSVDVVISLLTLGYLAYEQKDLTSAATDTDRALALAETLDPDSNEVLTTLDQRAKVAIAQGDLAAAERSYRRMLAIDERRMPGSWYVSHDLGNLGSLAERRGDLAMAVAYYRRALPLARDAIQITDFLGALALVAGKQGDWREAERLAGQAWQRARQQPPPGIEWAGRWPHDERLEYQAGGASAVGPSGVLLRAQLALRRPNAAFITLEEARAQGLLHLLAERQLGVSAAPAELRHAYQAAASARDRAEAALSDASAAQVLARRARAAAQESGGTPAELEQRQAALNAATKNLEAALVAWNEVKLKPLQLWEQIKKHSPRVFVRPLSPASAQRALPPDTLFLAFSVGEEKTHLFLLRALRRGPPSLTAHILLLGLSQLRQQIRAFRALATDRLADPKATVAAGQAIFARLFPPAARRSIQAARRLLISPDGPLWELPFAALVTGPNGLHRYLGAAKPITYTQSLTLFAQSRTDLPRLASGEPPFALVVGDPDFRRRTPRRASTASASSGTRPVEDVERGRQDLVSERARLLRTNDPPPRLKASGREGVQVARLYGGEPLTRTAATEAAVRRLIARASVIHFATHACLDPARAMSSGLLLSPPEQEPAAGETVNDGVLQAWEIYNQLKLKAELVVLSACQTGRGENVPGEGIVGLTWALQYAGARSIVASQWKVVDESTATLMVAFHRKLRQGLTKDEALRQAMALVRQDPRTAHPYYWAAFFLTGDPDNPTLGRPARRSGSGPAPRGR